MASSHRRGSRGNDDASATWTKKKWPPLLQGMGGMHRPGRLVSVGDTRLFVVEVGERSSYPVLIFHGGPGDDHHEFGDYLDPLADRGYRLLLVDQRAQGRSEMCSDDTWTLPQMAADVGALARSLELERYAALGHSFGAFVVLQNAVDFPGAAAQTIVSSGIPSARYLEAVDRNLAAFEPEELRNQVAESWARETEVETPEDFARLLHDQMPFHFADPLDPRIAEYEQRTEGAAYAPWVLRKFAAEGYGGIEVEDRLAEIPQPVLVLVGRHDRTCVPEAAEAMARGIPNAELVVFEKSAHMTFAEENARYVSACDTFLRRYIEPA
jgi:proline iminopeptidase